MSTASFFDRERTVAGPGYSRWLVPPAALAIHLAIGQVYSFSVFVKPLLGLHDAHGAAWSQKEVGYIFSFAIAVLGISAALFGRWLETAGPRKAMAIAALCFGLGFLVAAGGVALHMLPVIYLGYGIIGGVGLGLGYISPVSTLIKWFPDKPGLATGLAIMGFGGGAMIGAPLGTDLMKFYGGTSSHAIVGAWLTMGVLYFLFMLLGVFMIRVPAEGWKPAGWVPREAASASSLISTHNVTVADATRTPQFWLLWIVLCLNVTAGIGILEQASPMIQTLFTGRVSVLAAAGFVGVLSLFNMGGRFMWASLSDYIGRKGTYIVFFLLGAVLYFALPSIGTVGLFVLVAGVLISMYGGGFATIPAYLKDLFGGVNVSAIHGRLLTAWSTAGIVGPLIVNALLDHATATGHPLRSAYPLVLHVMSGLLLIGLLANLLVRPVAAKYWMNEGEIATPEYAAH
jgi:MFS family permease